MITLDNAVWFAYLFTRVDSLKNLLGLLSSVCAFLLVMYILIPFMIREFGTEKEIESFKQKEAGYGKISRILGYLIIPASLMLNIAIPTKEDLKVIIGVGVGAEVVSEARDQFKESELVSRVFKLAESKIDKVIKEAEK